MLENMFIIKVCKGTWINSFACSIVKTQSHICFRNVPHKAEEIQVIFEGYSLVNSGTEQTWSNGLLASITKNRYL